jgi:hypothetical protein
LSRMSTKQRRAREHRNRWCRHIELYAWHAWCRDLSRAGIDPLTTQRYKTREEMHAFIMRTRDNLHVNRTDKMAYRTRNALINLFGVKPMKPGQRRPPP